jgi:hypothetical protein
MHKMVLRVFLRVVVRLILAGPERLYQGKVNKKPSIPVKGVGGLKGS